MGRNIKRFLSAFLAVFCIVSANAQALETPDKLIPIGSTIGIRIETDGVMVVALCQVDSPDGARTPAADCGICPGDIITRINADIIASADDFRRVMSQQDGGELSILLRRGEKELQLQTAPCKNCDGAYELGIWLRDGIAGIGTVTFADPESDTFGALGHSVNDMDTGVRLPVRQGCISFAEISGIKKGLPGSPGELSGVFDFAQPDGSIDSNTGCGIFGSLDEDSPLLDGEAIPVAEPEEVKTGSAVILANIDGCKVREYAIEISRIYSDCKERSMMITVTDPQLLEATGGIVQGMSGSPIIQNGKLAGAVTHVLINNPAKGYGIFIENMLEAAG